MNSPSTSTAMTVTSEAVWWHIAFALTDGNRHQAEKLHTETGRERLAPCVFHVPVNGALVSMCEVNALGVRDRYDADLATAGGYQVHDPSDDVTVV